MIFWVYKYFQLFHVRELSSKRRSNVIISTNTFRFFCNFFLTKLSIRVFYVRNSNDSDHSNPYIWLWLRPAKRDCQRARCRNLDYLTAPLQKNKVRHTIRQIIEMKVTISSSFKMTMCTIESWITTFKFRADLSFHVSQILHVKNGFTIYVFSNNWRRDYITLS